MRICEKRPLKINIIHSILYTRIFVLIIIMYKGWCGFTWKRKKYKHITEYERIQIEALRRAGRTITQIAEQLQKNYSSIWRELQRGKYIHRNSEWIEEERYSSDIAQEKCDKTNLHMAKD